VSRVLLVTNDFPPRPGGIQSYLGEFVGRLADAGSHSVIVYAPQWKGADAFDESAEAAGYRVVRHPGTLMLPGPAVDARMRRLIADHGCWPARTATRWAGRCFRLRGRCCVASVMAPTS
jgi:phosphatidylinositol alpha-1,6-mannosyltransferase